MAYFHFVLYFLFVDFTVSNNLSSNSKPWECASTNRSANVRLKRAESDSVGNVQFDLPDLVTSWDAGNGARYQLEAFRDKRNDVLLEAGKTDPKKFFELRWVSLGQPRLVKVCLAM